MVLEDVVCAGELCLFSWLACLFQGGVEIGGTDSSLRSLLLVVAGLAPAGGWRGTH